jgi:VanZ family protein
MPRSNERFAAKGERKRARAFSIVAVVAVLTATVWPYDFLPRNHVTWLQGTTGLKFEKAGLVTSNEPLEPPEAPTTDSYSLDLLIRPASTRSANTILAFCSPSRPRQLWLIQDKDSLLLSHDEAFDLDRNKTTTVHVNHMFLPETLVLVTVSSGPKGTAVYRNGQPFGFFPAFRISRSELTGTIVVGTSPGMYDPWVGELRGLAVYSTDLTNTDALWHYEEWIVHHRPPNLAGASACYTFAEGRGREVRNDAGPGPRLEIPAIFSVPYKGFLRSVVRDFKPSWKYVKDVVMNIAGFIPLGLIVCASLAGTRSRWNAFLTATMGCGTLSFVIEVLQYFIPRRSSGVTDIITNTLGAALGAVLVQAGAVRESLEQMKLIGRR